MTDLKIFSIYLNNYILSKINFSNLKYLHGFAHHAVCLRSTPTSFATVGSACGIATKKQAQPAFGERLYFSLTLIFYLTCKIKLVLFSTNFILALFAAGKRTTIKMTNLKIFSIYTFYNSFLLK